MTEPDLTKEDVMKWLKKAKNTEVADKILSLVQDHNKLVELSNLAIKNWEEKNAQLSSFITINLWLKTAFIISTFALVYAIGVIL
ncbi:MAG TPA: hypothetical protein VMZ91_15675 [Candidatus Paceibacterota bacterium]|nr:hypothetical protein [Candidatus Paceibacterota bacterium]